MGAKLRAVLVGCGGISRAWLNGIQGITDLEMVGFVDIVGERAQARADEFGWHQAVVGAHLGDVLTQTRPDIVFDCTVPEAHVEVTLMALERGCHVLGEKPMADSMVNARRMVAAAKSAGKTYAVMQNRRHDASLRRLRSFLVSGALGPLTTVNSGFYIGAHFTGFRTRMRHPLLLDMAIHTFDAARLISGADPEAVTCVAWNPPGSWYDNNAAAVAVFEMTGGIVYTYQGSWCAEGMNTRWESEWRLIGTNGSAVWDGGIHFEAEVVAKTGGLFSDLQKAVLAAPEEEEPGGHAGLIRAFVRSVGEGTTPETVCTDNIKSLSMVFGAIESADKGRRVELADRHGD